MKKADLLVAPTVTPLSGTLLDHATIHEGIELVVSTDMFESYNCLTTDRRATWPCPETFITVPVQTASSAATTGGTVAADTYFSKITAITPNGETTASNEVSVTTTGSASVVTFNWNAVTNATGYKVYVTDGLTNTERYLKTVGAVTTTTWTGTPALNPANAAPPTSNTAEYVPTKTFEGPSWPDGSRFTVYAGIVCKRFGTEEERRVGLTEGRRVFESRESYGVERAVIETVLQGATDITPAGGAVDPKVGLALLEADAATKYAGVPTIHAPRSIASLLTQNSAIEFQGGKLYSALGSKIAAGGGYDASNLSPSAVVPAAGEKWLYASGEVLVLRSELIPRDELNRDTNESIDLIERTYIVAVDCFKSAVRVKVA